MAGYVTGDSSHQGVEKNGPQGSCNEETHNYGARWYLLRKEIEENSPSRRDGIDLKKEAYFRKSYCTFLQDLGMRLKVPQMTIATAIVFCHRFFLRQSHAKNDRRTIATVCMFLAGKVEETPRPLKDVILVSYEIIHKKDPTAVQRIKQKQVYEKQKERILLGERLVLATLGFDLNVHHPYKPLVEAIKKFKVAQNALAKVAWNFVNDGLRTSLCLQFKPHHIAAGAIFLAAKFIKVKLPSDGEKVWWQEFDITPRQLEDVSNQMLELYEQNRACAGANHPAGATSTVSESSVSVNAEGLSSSKRSNGDEVSDDRGMAAKEKNERGDDGLIERELEDGIELAGEDEKVRGWTKPLHRPLQASMKRKPVENVDEQCRDEYAEDGELSSLDELDYPSRKRESDNVKLSGVAKREIDEKGWSDHSGRNHKRIRFEK